MSSDSDTDDSTSSPSDIQSASEISELLPTKSALRYEKRYEEFIQWKKINKATSFSESVLLSYFQEMSTKNVASTLWTIYSMLKSTINIKQNIDISKYSKLITFLKRKNEGYKTKKAKTFSSEDINKFIQEAPDELYLFTKVALIVGIMGACRKQELYNLQLNDVEVFPSTILVKVKNTNTKQVRSFTITGSYHEICVKYIKLRPISCSHSAFFLFYNGGKCFDQRIGINKFGNLGKSIANYLNLPNPEKYTGHCFRRSSATLLVDADGDITARTMMTRHGGVRSTSGAEGYVVEVEVSDQVPQGTEFTIKKETDETESQTPQSTEFLAITTVKQEIEEDSEPTNEQMSDSLESAEETAVKNEFEEHIEPLRRPHVTQAEQRNSHQAADTLTEEEYITIGKSIAIQLRGVERRQRTIALRLISDAIQHANLGSLTVESAIILRPAGNGHNSYRNRTGD